MTEHSMTFTAAGIAYWGHPVRVDSSLSLVNFQAELMSRLIIEDGTSAFLRCRLVGQDEIDDAGRVSRGHAALELLDVDRDKIFGRVDWYAWDKRPPAGMWTFTGGTGKWANAKGEVEVALTTITPELEPGVAPDTPVTVYGFMEGEGRLAY